MQIINGGMRLTSTEMQSPAAPIYAIDVRAKLAIDAIIASFKTATTVARSEAPGRC